MQPSKHTPGPWHVVLSDNATPHIMHEHGDDWADVGDATSLVCHTPAEITRSYNALANARLIAAAPDMHEALHDLLTRPTDPAARERARQALAKVDR